MDITKMVFGGALIGTLVSAWGTIKTIAWKVCTLALKKVNLSQELSIEVLNYLRENYKYIHLHDRNFFYNELFTKKEGRYEKTGWENFANSSFLFCYGKIPFYLNNYESSSKDNTGATATTKGANLYYLRGTLKIDEIIRKAIERVNDLQSQYSDSKKETKHRFYIKYIPGTKKEDGLTSTYNFISVSNKCLSHDLDELGLQVSREGIKNVVLTEENKELVKLVELWKKNKQWYKDKDIPWKMGLLLHGPPGTGKTLLSRRIAEHLNMPIFVYKLGMLRDPEFSEEWVKMQSSTPCVALIEDFDNVFHGRENIVAMDGFMERFNLVEDAPKEANEDKLRNTYGRRVSFDNLLNTLDGAERYEGVLTIITTNHIDKIDSALLDRPGRIDKVIELTYLNEANKVAMIEKILHDMPNAKQIALQYIATNKGEHITPAQLQEKCISLALKEFYQNSLENQ